MEKPKKTVTLQVIILTFIFVVVIPFLPLLISNHWNWWEGWAYGLSAVISFVISRYIAAKHTPDILAERAKFMQHENAQPWDRKILSLTSLIGIVSVVVVGLDRLFSWTTVFNPLVSILGLVLLVAGYVFSSYALVINHFFSGTVRLQTDRGQHVISEGPYRWVRHPGYAGGLLSYLATPLLLNSLWVGIPILITVGLYALRTSLEDRFLKENLDGYREYAERVRYRLIPGLW